MAKRKKERYSYTNVENYDTPFRDVPEQKKNTTKKNEKEKENFFKASFW